MFVKKIYCLFIFRVYIYIENDIMLDCSLLSFADCRRKNG